MRSDMIAEANAVIFWNDTPTGAPGWDVLVTTIADADRDRRGCGFDNATGVIDVEWGTRPEATAKTVFDEYFKTDDVTSLTPAMWADVRRTWLTEFAKIDSCQWARNELVTI